MFMKIHITRNQSILYFGTQRRSYYNEYVLKHSTKIADFWFIQDCDFICVKL